MHATADIPTDIQPSTRTQGSRPPTKRRGLRNGDEDWEAELCDDQRCYLRRNAGWRRRTPGQSSRHLTRQTRSTQHQVEPVEIPAPSLHCGGAFFVLCCPICLAEIFSHGHWTSPLWIGWRIAYSSPGSYAPASSGGGIRTHPSLCSSGLLCGERNGGFWLGQ